MMRNLLVLLLISIAVAQSVLAAEPAAQSAQAAATCPPIANPNIVCQTYAAPPGESSSSSGSPLVLYFFSYTCFKCADFGDFVAAWSKRTRVSVLPVHAMWDSRTVRQMAEAFYAFERLGVTETLGPRLFAAIADKQFAFGGAEELARFADANGVRGDLVQRALASPRTRFKVAIAEHRTRKSRLEGVPFLIVNDRYGIGPKATDPQTLADLGALLDALVVLKD